MMALGYDIPNLEERRTGVNTVLYENTRLQMILICGSSGQVYIASTVAYPPSPSLYVFFLNNLAILSNSFISAILSTILPFESAVTIPLLLQTESLDLLVGKRLQQDDSTKKN
jgi:hypothetical protein